METGRRLTVSLLQVVVIAAAAFGLWRLEFSPLPKGADFLLWPVVIVAGLSLVLEIVFWLQRASRIRGALGLPDEFRPRTALFLQMTTPVFKRRSMVGSDCWAPGNLGRDPTRTAHLPHFYCLCGCSAGGHDVGPNGKHTFSRRGLDFPVSLVPVVGIRSNLPSAATGLGRYIRVW